jgi:CIC family chloride channel protein
VGPTVVLTSGAVTGFARALGLPQRVVRGMIPVGTAAGIAAIFNTPITGVVFALEEVIGTASRGVLGGAIVAAVAAAVVQKQAMGGEHLLPAAPAAWSSAIELVGFAWLGITAGAAAGYMPRFVERARERLRRVAAERGASALTLRGAGAGMVVGLLGLMAPESLGVGYDSISGWLAGGGDAGTAALAFIAKFIGMGVALGAGLVGGVFAPSLFLGASLGAAFGHSVGPLWPALGIDPGAYALVGMGAFFAGFLRTPIASVLIVFELTGDYNLVAPLMLAVALATLIAPRLSPATLVESALEERGVLSTEAGDPFALVRAREVMSREVVALPAHATLAEALQEARRVGHAAFPVIDGDGLCIGMLDNDELERAVAEGHGGETVLARRRPVRVLATAAEPLDKLALRLGAAGETRCPVVASLSEPRLVGFLTPMDFLRARMIAARDDKGDSDFQPLGP